MTDKFVHFEMQDSEDEILVLGGELTHRYEVGDRVIVGEFTFDDGNGVVYHSVRPE